MNYTISRMKILGTIVFIILILVGILGYTQRHAIKSLLSSVTPTMVPATTPTSTINSDSTAETFTAPTETPDQIIWDKELTPVINPNNSDVIVRVEKLSGNYAMGNVGKYGGAVWYAVKINGQWKEVWQGQNVISCKPVQQYNIPKEIYDMGGENSGCSNNY